MQIETIFETGKKADLRWSQNLENMGIEKGKRPTSDSNPVNERRI